MRKTTIAWKNGLDGGGKGGDWRLRSQTKMWPPRYWIQSGVGECKRRQILLNYVMQTHREEV